VTQMQTEIPEETTGAQGGCVGSAHIGVRAKFKVQSVEDFGPSRKVKLAAVSGDSAENASWSKWTPSGNLEMLITNPAAYQQFVPGASFYLDFSAAE
jgi:hypothetical protein